MTDTRIFLATAALLLATTGLANAATITTYTDRSTFAAAAGTTATEDFNGYSSDVSFASSTVDVGPFSLSLSTPDNSGFGDNLIDAPPFVSSQANVNGTTSLDVFTYDQLDTVTFIITFSSPITAFGADFAGFNDGHLRTQIVVGSDTLSPPITSSAGAEASFFGFVSDTAFDTVEFTPLDNDVFGIDNVTYSATATDTGAPEPASLALAGAGLAGLGALRRKRKAA